MVDNRKLMVYTFPVIESFKHKGLKELFAKGGSSKVRQDQGARILRRLHALDAASRPEQLNLPGFDFHALKGKPKRYSVHVNGPWTITFGWAGDNATDVNLEQYH